MTVQPSVTFYTLGCRLNQAETATLSDAFRQAGYAIKEFGEQTDICVINTCSVTGQSEARCRNMIRNVLRKHPDTFMVVVGCYAQIGIEMLRNIPGIDMIVGTEQKFDVVQLIHSVCEAQGERPDLPKQTEPLIFHSAEIAAADFTMRATGNFTARTRANIKIQDGCNFFCSYCIVPYTRGRDRSRTFEDIRREAQELAARGHQEIVITGVNIGTYAYQGKGFLDVLRVLEEIEGIQRIRITSIEPMTVPEGIIDYFATSGKLCHFLHIPLQSGSNAILEMMNRRYRREEFAEFVHQLTEAVPDIHIGTDIIVGFPGEGNAEFEESRELLATLPLHYAHVFSFSARQGTNAANLPHPVAPEVITERSEILRNLSKQKRQAFYKRHIGKTVSVLFERKQQNGLFTGYTGNYIKVGVNSDESLSNRMLDVVITEVTGDNIAVGRLC
ncbi:putative tRNA modifying enzyme, MiaB-like [Candidatus Moduliflexus flocculans]|uniref:Threonylcarbamoyladenosine tRNA methylthiotransferase MtaB n=1 Tax=Candidatus Moduliflexus flocculans TaxID=1499966 RepID=A0A081BSM6_9BACT|nr:putative tRNA modifying enzyme, MiaB-like [Candidatus Moduliflexus flocculans]